MDDDFAQSHEAIEHAFTFFVGTPGPSSSIVIAPQTPLNSLVSRISVPGGDALIAFVMMLKSTWRSRLSSIATIPCPRTLSAEAMPRIVRQHRRISRECLDEFLADR